MGVAIDLTNQIFGRLKVIGLSSKKIFSERGWICICECGKEVTLRTSYLKSGHTKSCGCLRSDNLLGKKFNKLLVQQRVGSQGIKNKKQIKWLCKCDCGKETIVTSARLTMGLTKSCGCLRKEAAQISSLRRVLPNNLSAFNRLFRTYKKHALKRNYVFQITKEEFQKLIITNCFYCGIEPKQKLFSSKNSILIYNGIDRIDNTQGYITSNIVACCGLCNKAKSALTPKDFSDWISNIIIHNSKKLHVFQEFYLKRSIDVSGISGIGIVAHGIVLKNDSCILQWNSPFNSIEFCDNIDTVEKIHGHNGATEVIMGSPPEKKKRK